ISPFGVGNSTFRTGSDKPIEVDTVFGGCYRRSVFEKIGFLNENLVSSSDIEFNIRLKRAGGKIFLFPDIIATYYTRTSFKKFVKNNFRNGFWAIYPLRFVNYMPVSFRHFIPLFFVLGILGLTFLSIFSSSFLIILLIVMSIYFFLGIFFSLKYVKGNLLNWFLPPVFFFLLHISYGIGSLYAFCAILFSNITKSKSKTGNV
ncbi:MAG: glycosyltransferase family 2 protein, partial [Bacteroidales bacterium]|nr:glycosyltransferase family 2 protein [Bacteroidales bacterium]